ncbi:MAG: Fur family transcriptional regulator [Clostridium sp.]
MKVEEILREKCIKVTKGRVGILEILQKQEGALSSDDIYELCKKENIDINLSTVYRVLEVFEKNNIVDKFTLNDGLFLFKLKGDDHKHLLECDVCHKEVEVECPMKQIEEIVKINTGFTLTDHNLKMKGICEECKDKE